MCTHMCVQVHVPMWRSEVDVEFLSLLLSTLIFEAGTVTEPGAYKLSRLTGRQAPGSSYVCLLALRL